MPTDTELLAYLDDALPGPRMAELEQQLRDDAALSDRLAALATGRDAGLHSLGEVWRRSRLTCPSREQLGSFLLGVLPDDSADYVRFHIEQIECQLCAASLEDLQEQATTAPEPEGRRKRYFESSVGRLRDEDP